MEEKIIIVKEDGTPDEEAMRAQKVKDTLDSISKNVKSACSGIWSWVKENREDLVVLVPLFMGAVGGLKKISNKSTSQTERERIDTTYYDPQTGLHWRTRRPLTNRERAELASRKRAGEYVEDILEDMRLLK